MKQTLSNIAPMDHGRRNLLRSAGLLVAGSGIGLAVQERPGGEERPLDAVERLGMELASALNRLNPGRWQIDGGAEGGWLLVRNTAHKEEAES